MVVTELDHSTSIVVTYFFLSRNLEGKFPMLPQSKHMKGCILFYIIEMMLFLYLRRITCSFGFFVESLSPSNIVSNGGGLWLVQISSKTVEFFAWFLRFNNYSFNVLLYIYRKILMDLRFLISSRVFYELSFQINIFSKIFQLNIGATSVTTMFISLAYVILCFLANSKNSSTHI